MQKLQSQKDKAADLKRQWQTETDDLKRQWQAEAGDLKQRLLTAEGKSAGLEQKLQSQMDDYARPRQSFLSERAAYDSQGKRLQSQNHKVADLETQLQVETVKNDNLGQQLNSERRIVQWLKENHDSILKAYKDEHAKVEHATSLIRLLSIATDSDVWVAIIQAIEQDPDLEPGLPVVSHSWKVLPPWSEDDRLCVRPDDHGLHSCAVDVIAMLSVPDSTWTLLLTRLCAIQEALMQQKTECMKAIIKMLFERISESIGDQRLHTMHRIVMYQIVVLLFCRWPKEVDNPVPDVERRFKVADSVAHELTKAHSGLDRISYPELECVVIGFGTASCVAVIYPQQRALRWVDRSRIELTYKDFKLFSNDESLLFPINSKERKAWCNQNLL
ncbi:hypothetical protein G7046_g4571 [Stylonectria norvegica]|nr:hypothetical protein G7046_g4571 [Stylonectria norvegica]